MRIVGESKVTKRKNKILSEGFFERDARIVARELLGKYLVSKLNGKTEAFMITETEAYLGEKDLASHARFGKTKRNAVMHGKAGVWYVYLIYGMYNMLNVVTGKEGKPEAVLIRELKEIKGPGKICRDLGISKTLNEKEVKKRGGLWIEDGGEKILRKDILLLPRVGVSYAGEYAHKLWRFKLKGV